MMSSLPSSPKYRSIVRPDLSAEERCLSLALHLCHVAAVHLVCDSAGQPQQHWHVLRHPDEPDGLRHLPSWSAHLGDEALIVIPDIELFAGWANHTLQLNTSPVRSVIRMLIRSDAQLTLGTLWLFDTTPRHFDAEDLSALEHLAQLTATLLGEMNSPAASMSDKSVARLRALLRNATDLVSINDANGIIQYISPSVTRILGYQADDLIGRSSFDFVHPDDIAAIARSAREATKRTGAQQPQPVHMRFRDIYGRWRVLEASSTNMLDDPQVRGMVVNARDVTEQIQAEDQLRVSETTLKAISQGVLMTGADRRIHSVNEAFTAITGYRQIEIQGRTCDFLQGPLTDSETIVAIRQAVVAGKEYSGEILNYRRDGTMFWNELTISPVYDEHGQLSNFVGIVRDVTERKRAQAALIETETRFRTIINVSPIPMGMNDGHQNITFLNTAFTQTFGYTKDDLRTLSDWWSQAYPDPSYRQWVAEMWRAELEHMQRSGGLFSPLEVIVRCKDGTNKTVLASAALISDAATIDYLVVLYDITTQKQAEAEKAKLEAQLYQAQKMDSIGRLAGGVAHDFNNMLGVILGHAELALAETEPTASVFTNLAEIQKAAQRSANLTRQLLAFARKQTIAPKILDLNKIVAGMQTMLERIIGENIELVWNPAAALWLIEIDPSQIDQILANLCVNARDSIFNVGQIVIETGNCSFDVTYCSEHVEYSPGEYVMLAVRDTGCGMNRETQERMFEPFFTTKPMGQGTGLGLATVYGIVKQNNGFLTFSSEIGIGTSFRIYLPRHSVTRSAVPDSVVVQPILRGGETILLVEDEPAILKLGSTILTRLGYHVLSAGSPGAAIQIAEAHGGIIHLLITDVIMPEMNGRDLANQLSASHPHMKRLFMSGYTAEIIAHQGVLEHGSFFIQKPFSMSDLAAKVREAVEHSTMHQTR